MTQETPRTLIQDASDFVERWFANVPADDPNQMVVCTDTKTVLSKYSPSDLERLAQDIVEHSPQFFRVALMDPSMTKSQGGKEESRLLPAICLDVDANKDGHGSRKDVLKAIKALPIEPHLLVNTRDKQGGFHVWWVLDVPTDISTDERRAAIVGLIASIRASLIDNLATLCPGMDRESLIDDKQTPWRLMRIPGTTRTVNGEAVQVTLRRAKNQTPVSLSQLLNAYPPVAKPEPSQEALERLSGDESEYTHDDAGTHFNRSQKGVEIVAELMREHGHQVWKKRSHYVYKHMDSLSKESETGTVGKCKSQDGNYLVTCFSDNMQDLEKNESGHTLHYVYAQLEHDGDISAATAKLYEEGFGKQDDLLATDDELFAGLLAPEPTVVQNPVTSDSMVGEGISQDEESGEQTKQDRLAAKYKPRSVKELQATTGGQRRPYLIEGLLREGETMNIIASPKVGKSWMVYNFAVTCSAGKPVLGFGGGRKIKTLLVDNELHEHELSNRTGRVMEAILGHKDEEGFQSICLRGENIDINKLGEVLAHAGAGQFDLLVLDALYRFLPKGVSENDNAAMMRIYNKLDQYAKLFDVGIVVVHHASKGSQGDKGVTDVGAGAGSIARATDTHVIIREHLENSGDEDSDNSHLFVLDAAVRSGQTPASRTLQFNFPIWEVKEGVEAVVKNFENGREKENREKAEKKDKDIGECLAYISLMGDKGATVGQLAAQTQRSESWVSKILKGLCETLEIQSKKFGQKNRYYSMDFDAGDLLNPDRTVSEERRDTIYDELVRSGESLSREDVTEILAVKDKALSRLIKDLASDERFRLSKNKKGHMSSVSLADINPDA